MARDFSRFRIPHHNQPDDHEEYAESVHLPPEVASYLRMSRRQPYVIRGIIAGSFVALAGTWLIFKTCKRGRTKAFRLPEPLPTAI